ncbi:hypothetical protein TorRG33x02_264600 [Trema orientale]|uniref:RNase H type-1 domain-containing protein n=1 Tax=Trema orientale TaxID=63057 RepID=A0A2P5D288_TREOI|nr:hypothetical protein TorRG33x02_264600 [Trema orientale]
MEDNKLLAIRNGLQFATQNGIEVDVIECDALRAAQGINLFSTFAADASIILDIKSLMTCANCGTCQFILRLGNRVAHELAVFAFSIPSNCYWIDCIPTFISSHVVTDMI